MWQTIKQWRRNRILANARFDEPVWSAMLQRFPFTRALSPAERVRLRELTILFLHEKHFSTAHGLQLNDAMRLHVAVQACTLIFCVAYLTLVLFADLCSIVSNPRLRT